MSSLIRLFLMVTTIIAVVKPLYSQTIGPAPDKFSLWARPLSECRYFLLTSTGVGFKLLGEESTDRGTSFTFSGDLAFMSNLTQTTAVGAGFSVFSFQETHFGFGLRYRRWVSSTTAFDLSPRFYFASTFEDFNFPGFGITASWTVREQVSADLTVTRIQYGEYILQLKNGTFKVFRPGDLTQLSVGVSGRSHYALIMGLGLLSGYLFINAD